MHTPLRAAATVCLFALLLTVSCTGDGGDGGGADAGSAKSNKADRNGGATPVPGQSPGGAVPTGAAPDASRKPVDLTTGLHTPWGLAPLPDGGALVSDRDAATVSLIPAGGGPAVRVGDVP